MNTGIVQKWNKYCVNKNFIGLGSTRKVYRFGDYVFKVNVHGIGYQQSLREYQIYEYMRSRSIGFEQILAAVYFVNEEVCIQQYYNELPMYDNQTFDINEKEGYCNFPKQYKECLEILDKEFDSFDLKDSSNYGLNDKNELVLIDYGMSKKIYNQEWVPAVERGEIPQIEIHVCVKCEIKTEIRMYGENDTDKRCIKCGKE
ncbi:protein kinase [Bacillus sp. OAE603]|uniref:protein kinase n=1 Tax=Gottfriedia sp. OAE603 TaxID=2663872 RepID=UPI00178B2AA4